jgi:16S rRNA (guanine(966)-N(2))-methyltransferase RsmD
MRISSGKYKGRKIGSRKLFSDTGGASDLRPTPSKVREAIFDILRGVLEGASFLDLYAGSGTIGIEAASRGAGRVTFVESVRARAEALRKMTDKIGMTASTEIHCAQVDMFLRKASGSGEQYDIIFVDPPYASDEIGKILPLIAEYGILDAQGVLLVEHARKKQVPERMGTLMLCKQYRYGDTMLALYRKAQC